MSRTLCFNLVWWGIVLLEKLAFAETNVLTEYEYGSLPARNLSELKSAGWLGLETAKHYDHPKEFKSSLSELESWVIPDGVWVEFNNDSSSVTNFSYTFNTSYMICDATITGISLTYYGRFMTVYGYPYPYGTTQRFYMEPYVCEDYFGFVGMGFGLSLEPENEVEVGGFLLPGGYIVFEEIFIHYEGGEGCLASTTTQATSPSTDDTTVTPDPDPETTPTITMESSTATATPTTEQKDTSRPSEEPSTTTEIGDPSTFNPDACDHDCEYVGIDCHNYYSCINYTRKEYYECNFEDGLAFNPALKVCDRIENVVECRPTTTELPSTTTPPEEDCVCEYKPHETDCSKYYFCPESCRPSSCELRICPGGLLWSVDYYGDESVHQQCKLPEKANCVSDGGGGARLEFSCYKQDDGFYPDEKDCRSYWKCVEGRAQLYDCSKGYVYNADTQVCDMAARSMRFCSNNENVLA
ncbi:unnamed protein product [Orchesella dallaii]|uniref:Chitin-binding type-2 domain-containing protein n=1 Tax=Orchesella dallaii TaxID=48710 RepID=A0ABP1R1N2_9HEXA